MCCYMYVFLCGLAGDATPNHLSGGGVTDPMVRVNQHFVVVLSSVSFTCLKWQVHGQVCICHSALPRGDMARLCACRVHCALCLTLFTERLSFVCESGDGTREARVSDFYGGWRRGKTAGRRAALAPRLELLAARRRVARAGSRARRAFRGRASARAAGQSATWTNNTRLKHAPKLDKNAKKWPTGIE